MEETKYIEYYIWTVSNKDKVLEDITYSEWLDCDTKTLFEISTFERKTTDMDQMKKMIENKAVFFPIGKSQNLVDIKNYIDAGFIPYFVKMTEYRRIKKLLMETEE